MKTKYWVLLLAAVLLCCIVLSLFLLMPDRNACFAEIISNGQILHVVDLRVDRVLQIAAADGSYNTVTVKDGRIGVTQASCPDHHCIHRGMCSGGTQIVCLPNRLVIRFLTRQDVDTVSG